MNGPQPGIPFLGCCDDGGGITGKNYKRVFVEISKTGTTTPEIYDRLQRAFDIVAAFDFSTINFGEQRTIQIDDNSGERVEFTGPAGPNISATPYLTAEMVASTIVPTSGSTYVRCSGTYFAPSVTMETLCTRYATNTHVGSFGETQVDCFRSVLPIRHQAPLITPDDGSIARKTYQDYTDPDAEGSCCPIAPP